MNKILTEQLMIDDLVGLDKSEIQQISGGCSDDASFWYKLGCAIAKFMNATDGNINRGPRNGYYF